MAGAPLGNQNALGHGRPRKWDDEELAIKMDEWSAREDARWIGDFALYVDMPDPKYVRDIADRSIIFASALKRAKLRIASRLRALISKKDSEYNYGLFMREITLYDVFLKEHEREEKAYESSLRQKEAKAYNDKDLEDQEKLCAKLDRMLQEKIKEEQAAQSKDLSADESNKSTDK